MLLTAVMHQTGLVGCYTSRPSFTRTCSCSALSASRLGKRGYVPCSRPAVTGKVPSFPCMDRSILTSHLRGSAVVMAAAGPGSLFPGGGKQAKVKLPALFLKITAPEVLSTDGKALQTIEDAVSGGATGVVLFEGAQTTGGADLYDAACRLRDTLRSRAVLLVLDRTDIADAAGVDGVLLSSQGVPIAVARRLLSGASSLVGSMVSSAEGAVAAAEQGANFILLQCDDEEVCASVDGISAAVAQQKAGSIPVLTGISDAELAAVQNAASALLTSQDLSGIFVSGDLLPACASATGADSDVSTAAAAGALIQAMEGIVMPEPAPPKSSDTGAAEEQVAASGLRRLVGRARDEVVAAEKAVLEEILALLKEVSPGISEVELLEDAIKNLDEQFLLVVVGEFNSGKSSFINALLGKRFLAEGILPTTNEISVLRWSENEERTEQDADGMYQRYLPADLLKDITIVDTPGTNVVLQRQQRLTEEYIPRADMVLFVLSADRPFTDSEVNFLKYIRQWGKKVVFIVNKSDLLAGGDQVDQVCDFVSKNALDILGLDSAQIVPISSRNALEAKLRAGSAATGGILSTIDDIELFESPLWRKSGFAELEALLLQFLVGDGPDKVSESVRLKLQTPLAVADALLGASQQQLQGDLASAEKDLKSLELVEAQLQSFRAEMERDSSIQREKVQKLVRSAVAKAEEIVDRELQLSSSNLTTYMFKSKGGQAADQPVAQAFSAEVSGLSSELQRLVEEHSVWTARNVERQLENYRSFASAQAEQFGLEVPASEEGGNGEASQSLDVKGTALAAVSEIEPKSAGMVLNEEVREAFVLTGTAVAGAGVLEAIGTSVLPTTLEDLLMTAVAGIFGYLAVLNLPLRRAETKAKVQKVAANFAKEVNEGMERELEASLDAALQTVTVWVDPLITAAQSEVEQVKDAERRRAALADTLEEMQQTTSSISS